MSPDGDTDYFKITAGVMQGDTLAPFLFVIVLDYALRKAIDGRELELGLTLIERRGRRYPPVCICDLDFADDIVLISNEIEQAKLLLYRVETECRRVGLGLNVKKTKGMFFNVDVEPITTIAGHKVEQALTESKEQDFKYLGSWTEQDGDVQTRKAQAWKVLNKLEKLWKSDLPGWWKIRFFKAAVETILLYGCATWSLTKAEEKSLDGSYTRMLRKVLNVNALDKIKNVDLYGDLPPISQVIQTRRLKLAGHVFRDKTSPAHQLVTWDPAHGKMSRGKPVVGNQGFKNSYTSPNSIACARGHDYRRGFKPQAAV